MTSCNYILLCPRRDHCVGKDIVDEPVVSNNYLLWYNSTTKKYITLGDAYYCMNIIYINLFFIKNNFVQDVS